MPNSSAMLPLTTIAFFMILVSGAQAQVAFPAAELRAMGASSVAVILPHELNCISGNERVGKNDGTSSAVTEGNYTGSDGAFNCATASVQPNITGRYISTGSATGLTSWKGITNALTGASGLIFPTAYGTSWTNVHFAMSDAPMSSTELTAFNTASAAKGVAASGSTPATKGAGAAIQFPLYVLPVAIAYNAVYGKKVDTNTELRFNVTNPVSAGTAYSPPPALGGLRLTKAAYCGIFNGYITNWNNPKITASNTYLDAKKKVQTKSLMDPADSLNRWHADGVPIRLVGRLDKSGTTDIFTRHLAAVCGGVAMSGPNKYTQAAETLPYATSSAIDMTSVKSDSNIKPSVSSSSLAGTADMISGAYYASGVIVTTKGAEALGKYIVANGTSDVANAINLAPDKASASDSYVLLNGKIGYVAADYVAPTPNRTLLAAALEQGNSASTSKPIFLMPTAANAAAAFGDQILPPQSDEKGKYVNTPGLNRSNPLDWYNALYFGGYTLANPVNGYAITGTSQFLSGTCFASPAVRNGLVTFLNATLGNLKLDSANAKLSPNAFIGTTAGKMGFKAQVGIAPLPTSWATAITETFLKYSFQKAADGTLLGALGLYIQNGLPTAKVLGKGKTSLALSDLPTTPVSVLKAAVPATRFKPAVPAVLGLLEAEPNPNCTNGEGL